MATNNNIAPWKGIASIILIVLGFFLAMSEDVPVWLSVVGWIILGITILAWIWFWINQNKNY